MPHIYLINKKQKRQFLGRLTTPPPTRNMRRKNFRYTSAQAESRISERVSNTLDRSSKNYERRHPPQSCAPLGAASSPAPHATQAHGIRQISPCIFSRSMTSTEHTYLFFVVLFFFLLVPSIIFLRTFSFSCSPSVGVTQIRGH